jgi:hypothetical protein
VAGTENLSSRENQKVGKGGKLISAMPGRYLRVFQKRGRMDGGKEASSKVNRKTLK